jgi:hypothetical protein
MAPCGPSTSFGVPDWPEAENHEKLTAEITINAARNLLLFIVTSSQTSELALVIRAVRLRSKQ